LSFSEDVTHLNQSTDIVIRRRNLGF